MGFKRPLVRIQSLGPIGVSLWDAPIFFKGVLKVGEGADMGRGRYSVLTGALELAVLFFPLLSISDLVVTWYPFDTTVHYILAGWLLPAVSGLLCFCVLVSESAKAALKKWALSIPFTVIFWLALAATDFEVRLTNTLYPGYGSLSAGGGLALVIFRRRAGSGHPAGGLRKRRGLYAAAEAGLCYPEYPASNHMYCHFLGGGLP